MTDAEYAAQVRALMASTGTPPAPSMVREPAPKSDADLGIDDGPITAPAPRTAGTVAREGLNAVGTAADDALDAATGDLYTKGRNAAANAVAPGEGDKTAADESKFNAAHPAVEGTARAVGAMSPVGVPALEARTLEAAASPVVAAGARALGKVAAGAGARIAGRAEREVAAGASKAVKQRLYDIAPGDTAAVAKEFGLRPGDPNAVKAGIRQVASAMQAPYQAVEAVGGTVAQKDLDAALTAVESKWAGTTATAPLAKEVGQFRADLAAKYGPAGGPTPRELQDEITAMNKGAFGGNYANPTVGKTVQRMTTGALKNALEAHLGQVAEVGGPEAARAVEDIRGLNKKMQVLKTLEPAVKDAAVAERFPTKAADRKLDMHALIPGGTGGAIGATVGGLVAGFPGAVAGGALGAITGAGAKAGARAIDAKLASIPAQKFAAAGVPRKTLAAAQPVMEALTRKDPEGAKRALVAAVTGSDDDEAAVAAKLRAQGVAR